MVQYCITGYFKLNPLVVLALDQQAKFQAILNH